MTGTVVVTGTDTGVGKTVFSAALAVALGARYWKPVQSGLEDGGDAAAVAALGVPADRVLPEAYRLATPCSPHRAAELDGVEIDVKRLTPPVAPGPLVVEGAGGALVPVTRRILYADLFERWGHPVVMVARTELGTINHSLLTLEALHARRVPVLGVAFVGDPNEDSEATIAALGGAKRLGRLPRLGRLAPKVLHAAFADHFRIGDFR
ncbi:dethiobiotin synthase [uncultured Sphingomonas sp.]|uniref:dethiobiotin synthase n=1 Tax=uncultured Sphingomonas sp. TaxID=158754 RepID=UPI0035C95269